MAHKLLFAFDLKAKPITSYTAIRDRISKTFGILSYREILNTTYIIRTDITPSKFNELLIGANLLDQSDFYICSDLLNPEGRLLLEHCNFINL